jgi:hypothetical protein
MRRAALAAAALPFALAALTACGESEASENSSEDSFEVADGVQKQYEVLAEEVAARGGSTTSGEWTVSFIVEAAEPWFEGQAGHHQAFREPKADETHHIEIIPTETATGRIVPDVPITLEVVAADGTVVDKQKLNFYYSTFFHYANNFHVPDAGDYTLRATLGVPEFNRHGEPAEGPALAEGATVEFTGVALTQE